VAKKSKDTRGTKRPSNLSGARRVSDIDRLSDIRPKRDPERRQEVDRAIAAPSRIGQRHQAEVQGPREYPHRITFQVEPDILVAVERYSEADRVSVSQLVGKAVEEYLIGKQEKDGVTSTNDSVVLESPTEIIHFSRLLISAIEDTLEFSVDRHHNRPPPALMIEDATEEYLHELRRLVAELKSLNENLEALVAAPAPKRKRAEPSSTVKKSAVDVKKHLNTFLDRYAKYLAPGAAMLTIGTVSALLNKLGVPPDAFTAVLKSLKP
jgi:hypothetical protein